MFESLFGWQNPTKMWQRPNDLRLDFDLELGSLNNVRLGSPLEAVSFLGPVEDRQYLRNREYPYPSLGLSVGCDECTIYSFRIVQCDNLTPSYRPFAGHFQYREKALALPQLNASRFVEMIGPPFWKNEDDSEIIHFYEFPWIEWQVEFGLDGSFKCITITSAPLLAEERVRTAYGVTTPWPPRNWA